MNALSHHGQYVHTPEPEGPSGHHVDVEVWGSRVGRWCLVYEPRTEVVLLVVDIPSSLGSTSLLSTPKISDLVESIFGRSHMQRSDMYAVVLLLVCWLFPKNVKIRKVNEK